MNDLVKVVGKLEYTFMFHSKTQAHFCVVHVDSKSIQFCFDWDISGKQVIQFLDNVGEITEDSYSIDNEAIEHMERIFNLKAFF